MLYCQVNENSIICIIQYMYVNYVNEKRKNK